MKFNNIQSALESQAFIFSDSQDKNIRNVRAALSAEVSAVIYLVSTTVVLRISIKKRKKELITKFL